MCYNHFVKNENVSNKTNKVLKNIIWFISCLLLIAVIGGAIYFYKLNTDVFNAEYSVVFDAGDITLTQTEFKLKRGNCITLPVLEKEGYTFDGWYCENVKWEDNTPITKNVNLVAKFTPKKYKITFIVDDNVFEYYENYNSLPTFPNGTPSKQPTETTQFDFVGFEPELVSVNGEATYTAKFEENIRKFNVVLTSNIENACTFLGNQSVEYDGNTTINFVENFGYKFVAWYFENEVYSTEKQIIIENVKSDLNFVAKFELINYTITYVFDETLANENITTYNVSMDNVVLKELSKEGCVFKGWFTKPNGEGEKIEVLNANVVSVNLKFYAYFSQNVVIKFVVDGFELNFDRLEIMIGQNFAIPSIDTSKYGMSAYSIDGFYLQSDCNESSKIDETKVITENTTLYGKWKYILDVGFFAYKEEFDNARTTKSVYINSESKFICWIDYIKFYNILSSDIKINFGSDFCISFSTETELTNYLTTIFNEKSEYPNGIRLSYSFTKYPTYKLVSVCVYENNASVLGTKDADPTRSKTIEQYEYAFLTTSNKRSSNFDNFNINKVNQTISVSSTNQLVYALEKGYRPIPEKGSSAENIYNKAKEVLREICDDDMSEFEKIKAIYDWLVLNVQYDSKAAYSSEISSNWTMYDAWYPEGVFNNHKAVCDGIARSLLILARIENIATIRVSGEHTSNGVSVGHAWNKVYINGNWYGIDATHGNPIVSNKYEVLTYTSFLFSDDFKHICCSFEIKSGTETLSSNFNVYAQMIFGEEGNSFDLYINDVFELNKLVSFVNAYVSNADYYQGITNHAYFSIEFALAKNCGFDINFVCAKLKVSSYLKSKAGGDIEAYCFVIKF